MLLVPTIACRDDAPKLNLPFLCSPSYYVRNRRGGRALQTGQHQRALARASGADSPGLVCRGQEPLLTAPLLLCTFSFLRTTRAGRSSRPRGWRFCSTTVTTACLGCVAASAEAGRAASFPPLFVKTRRARFPDTHAAPNSRPVFIQYGSEVRIKRTVGLKKNEYHINGQHKTCAWIACQHCLRGVGAASRPGVHTHARLLVPAFVERGPCPPRARLGQQPGACIG